jgi:hypothetical protein
MFTYLQDKFITPSEQVTGSCVAHIFEADFSNQFSQLEELPLLGQLEAKQCRNNTEICSYMQCIESQILFAGDIEF